MSHTVELDCFVQDLALLEAVAGRMGFDLVRDQTSFKWFGEFVDGYEQDAIDGTSLMDPSEMGQCAHVLRLRDARDADYEIGVIARKDGKPGYRLAYDPFGTNHGWGGHRIAALAGDGLVKLRDELNAEVSARVLARQGYRVTRRVDAKGVVEIVGTKA